MAQQQVDLFALGYTVEPRPGTFGVFHVFNATNGRYIVDCREETCNCPSWEIIQRRGGGPCKHLSGIRDLIEGQIKNYYDQQKMLAGWLKTGRISVERARIDGQELDDMAWALQSIADNLWGTGEMFVPAGFSGCR